MRLSPILFITACAICIAYSAMGRVMPVLLDREGIGDEASGVLLKPPVIPNESLEGGAQSPNKFRLSIVPKKALDVLEYVRKTGKAPPGYVGGRIFKNLEGRLPSRGRYREYDVDPRPSHGRSRNAERLVVDDITGRAWYTKDHYGSFTEIK